VTTPTLILHGEADDRCPIGQGEEFYVGLVAQGKVPTEFVRYPGGSHLFVGQGRPSHRVDYSRRVVDWVERYTTAGAERPREMAAATGDD
jgi:dipeptidyl aminopeptidase/acylaminoacyl peptidase